MTNLDRNFTNILQDENIVVTLYYKNAGDTHTNVKQFFPPSYIPENHTVWDVCFFCPPFIFETGAMHKDVQSHYKNFDYYKKMTVYFKNRKNQKFNNTFGNYLRLISIGFDSHGVYRTDDTWVASEQVVNCLVSLLADKLLSHE